MPHHLLECWEKLNLIGIQKIEACWTAKEECAIRGCSVNLLLRANQPVTVEKAKKYFKFKQQEKVFEGLED